jgi:hypothetical protein
MILTALVMAIAVECLHAQWSPMPVPPPQLVLPSLHGQTNLHRKLKSHEKTIRSVTLLPPTVIRANCRVVLGCVEAEEEESREIRFDLAGIVSDALRKRGWEVDDHTFSDEALQSEERLRNLVDYLRVRHANLVLQMVNRPKDTSKGRYSLGEEVASLGSAARTDVLVLVHSHLFARWNEKMMSLYFSLVDSHSGEVLCFSRACTTGRLHGLTREQRIQLTLKELRKVP